MTYYFSTLRHLTLAQIWHRGRRTIRRRWWRLCDKRSPQTTHSKLAPHTPLYSGLAEITSNDTWSDEIAVAIAQARANSGNSFSFLHQSVSFADQIGWHDPELSQLWRYHLHYFDYVRDLLIWAASGEREVAYGTFRRLALSWIEGNQALSGDGWHPYTISLRVVNWLNAFSFFSEDLKADAGTADLLLRSAYGQVQILFSDLELDVRGNHLLENLRALIWAGLAFEGPEARSWLDRGLLLLEREVSEQVLSDGGHFERSPGYHLVVFKDLLEIALWLRKNNAGAPGWLEDALGRMREYLWAILAPDGNVPLLKDTAWDVAPEPNDLLIGCAMYFDEQDYKSVEQFGLYPLLLFGVQAWLKFKSWPANHFPRGSIALPASGHYVLRDEQSGEHLILDAGKTCPDYLPAHAHADSLTYEFTVAGQRIVVDSGVYEYKAGAWRDYFRSTRAHNTLEVAGENQSEVWSSFRVGRRARPGPVVWQPGRDYVLVQGEHDGYRRLGVSVIHQRTIVWSKEKFCIVADQLWGNGSTAADNQVHLHPDLSFEMIDALTWRIMNSRVPLYLKTFGESGHAIVHGQTEPLRQGWYSERFGELEPNSVLTLHQSGALPLCYGYVITRDVSARPAMTSVPGGHEIGLLLEGGGRSLKLLRNEAPRFA